MKKLIKLSLTLVFSLTLMFSLALFSQAKSINVDFKLNAVNTTAASISWTDIDDADGYAVYLYNYSKKTWVRQSNAYTNKTLITGLSNKSKNTIVIRSFEKVNGKYVYSSLSKTFSFYLAPNTVTNIALSVSSNNSLTIKVTKPFLTSGYAYCLSDDNGRTWKVLKFTSATSYTLTGLKDSTNYMVKVRSYHFLNGKATYGYYSSAKSISTDYKMKLTSNATTSAKISWTASKGADGYMVYKYNNATKKWVRLSNVYTNSVTLTGLSNTQKCYVRIRAYDKVGSNYVYSDLSNIYSFYPAPNMVSKVSLSLSSNNDLKITTTKANGATAYAYYLSEDNGATWKGVAYTSSLSYTVKGLKDATNYMVKVRSYHKLNGYTTWGALSNPVNITTDYNIKYSAVTSTSATISWDAIKGADGYLVFKYNNAKKTWDRQPNVYTNTLKLTGLSNTEKCYIMVRAYEKVNGVYVYSNFSKTCSFYPATNLSIGGVFESSASIKWDKIPDATGYEIQQYNYATKTWSKLSSTTGTFQTLTRLSSGTQYQYKVRSYQTISGKNYYSEFSNSVSFYTLPSAVSSFDLKVQDANKVVLNLTKVTGAQGYEVSLSSDSGKTWSVAGTISTLNFTTNALSYDTEYQFKVRAYHSYNGEKVFSPDSQVKSIKTESITELENFSATNVTGSSATVTWDDLTDATYKFEMYSKNKWVVLADNLANPTYNLTSLDNSLDYEVKVRVTATVKSGSESVEGTAVNYTFNLAPTTVQRFIVTKTSSSSITIDWTRDYQADGYEIYLSTNNGNYNKIDSTEFSSYEAKGLTNGVNYNLKVKAYTTNDGVKAYSDFSEPKGTSVLLSTPTNLVEKNANNNTMIEFTWDKCENVDEYKVYKYSPVYNSWNFVLTTDSESFSVVNSSTSAASYLYKVVSYKDSIISEDSEIICIDKYGATTSFDGSKTEISWPSVNNAKAYTVSILSPDGSTLTQLATTTSPKAVLRLAPQSIQSLQIKAYSDTECKNYIGYAAKDFTIFTKPMRIITNTQGGVDMKDLFDSKREQLLFLTQAINNTKYYQNELILDSVSSFKFAASNFGVSGVEIDIEDLLGSMGDTGLNEQQIEKTNAFFNNGESFSNGPLSLEEAFAPFSNDAYLYNSQSDLYLDYTQFTKIFSNATAQPFFAKKLENGSYEYTIKLAEETNSSKIHEGFLSVIDEELFGDDSFQVGSVNYGYGGGTTIIAVVSADGILESYNIQSPFKFTKSKFSFTQEDSPISITFDMQGYTNYEYIFTK